MINVLRHTILFVIFSLLFLIGCSNDVKDTALEEINNQSPELMKLSTQGITDQRVSNQAKQSLSEHPEVSQVRAVNIGDDLFVAVDIRQRDRFSLDKIDSKLRKQLIEQYPNMNVTLSTDQKFIIELEKLEKKIDKKDIKNKTLEKRIDKLKKLSKEET